MIYQKAYDFIQQMGKALHLEEDVIHTRLNEIQAEIAETGTYTHTLEELIYGARVAWRNSNRCIGRLFWDKLNVVDMRHINQESDYLQAFETHIQTATNNGKIIPTITIFNQSEKINFELFNDQLIRYSDDPIVTEIKQKISQTGYDTFDRFLPLLYKYNHQYKTYDIKPDIIKEVRIMHPDYPKFNDLNLKWYAVPIISGMELRIGGITYPLCPFNGWYMESEIASRNFLDEYRYNLLSVIGESMDFDTSRTTSYWRDKVVVELNYAVYHSFKQQGYSIVDHYNASKQFLKFEENEKKQNRTVTGDWTWLIPPISPSLVHNWHKGYQNTYYDPNFYYKKQMTACPIH
ncbi:nitric oxide synthase oxygenase [Macrococcoides caseolyticum]|uniref:nitric oxide synthase oxygenase n=1 Tax=Macrococcoides caseolyticum TaxID=69966 RepID=UPI001F3F4339|nr:nitric oxide synthase oxygenase [Macrococcus caseolyticus]MCE4957455.1 nitric oxide synthase oxygenase [Macrococcus caseolyticus]